MDIQNLQITWLGPCPTCERTEHQVETIKGTKGHLYEDDQVKCWCGQTGLIETSMGSAWCEWDVKKITEHDKFNAYYRKKYPEYWALLPSCNHQACTHHGDLFNSWLNAKAQSVPEGFVLVPTEKVKYFSNNGESYETHDTIDEAKRVAESAIEWFSEQLADQQLDPECDGNFHQVGYGVILAESGHSIDHIVTQEDIDKGDYSYEVGTQIMSLFLIEAQEQNHEH